MNAKELFLKDIHFTKKKTILSLVFEPLAFLTLAGFYASSSAFVGT